MLLVGLIRDANYWVYLGIAMQGNRLIECLIVPFVPTIFCALSDRHRVFFLAIRALISGVSTREYRNGAVFGTAVVRASKSAVVKLPTIESICDVV
jgi:hypothetical protein